MKNKITGHGRGRLRAIPWAIGMLLGVTLTQAAHAQVATTLDEQEQLRRAQAQAAQREQAANAPNVQLQAAEAQPEDDGKVPVESPCFKFDQLTLVVPPGLSDRVEAAGAHALLPNPLFPGELMFAQNYLQRYQGQCVGREGLNLIVHRLAALIINKGYSTTRVVIGSQDLSTGKLELHLIPGVISDIRFADPATYGTWRNAFPTRPGDLLNLRDIEQGLEQLKRVPNQDATMQIVPGPAPGESDIVITVKRTKPWAVSVGVDDAGLESTGRYEANTSLTFYNPLGLSDVFNIGYSHDIDGHESKYGTHGSNATYSLPWGNWTFSLSGSQYDYHQNIAGAFANIQSAGESKTWAAKAEYMVYRNQVQKNQLEFQVGKYYAQSFIDGTSLDVQHRDNTYAEIGWEHKHYIGPAQLDSTVAYRWGVSWLGAQPDLPGVATGGPTFYYHMETVDATLTVPFTVAGIPLRYMATIRGQNSPNALYPTEDFTIGGRYTVRGFDGNTLLAAEKGAFMRNDLEMPIPAIGQAVYIGIDGGEVFGPSAHNLLGRRLAGAVFGMRGNLFQHVSYDAFIGGSLYAPSGFPSHGPVLGFNVNFQL